MPENNTQFSTTIIGKDRMAISLAMLLGTSSHFSVTRIGEEDRWVLAVNPNDADLLKRIQVMSGEPEQSNDEG